MSITSLGSVLPAAGSQAATTNAPSPGTVGAFAASLSRLVSATEAAEADANATVAGMLQGDAEIHDAMIALQRADLSLQLTVQVRNKLVAAYNEIMRMPV